MVDKFYGFSEKANKIHNFFYSYGSVNYLNARTKITITCPIHGDFSQLPFNHLKGKGCSKCGIEKTRNKLSKNSNTFIRELKSIYGDIYDYSLVDYLNDTEPVKILCKEHGMFEKRPTDLLYGRYCKKCNLVLKKEKKEVDRNSEFIEKSKRVWSNKYDYSLVNYINSKTVVKIICKRHGVFEQTPNTHLGGSGCPSCQRINKDEFLEKIPVKFREIYDYSDVYIISKIQKIELLCKKHGKFQTTVWNHINGNHCKKCTSSSGEELIIDFLNKTGLEYEFQYVFKGCFNERHLRFDFFLRDQNICIEYDGEQHFKPIKIFGGELAFEKQKRLDSIKDEFCKKNKIKLIRIPFNNKTNISKILSFLI